MLLAFTLLLSGCGEGGIATSSQPASSSAIDASSEAIAMFSLTIECDSGVSISNLSGKLLSVSYKAGTIISFKADAPKGKEVAVTVNKALLEKGRAGILL